MKRRSKVNDAWEENVNKIVGLGGKSIRKSYYPELKEKINSLDRKNAYYQSILKAIPDGVVITNPSNVIVQINPALVILSGYEAEELTGKKIAVLYSDQPQEREEGMVWTEAARYYRCKDGTRFIGESHSSKIIDENGIFIGNLEIIRDISKRIEIIGQQRKMEAQLLKSQKMEAIGSLAGGVAHDFNNILCAIIGYAELIELFELTDIDEIHHNVKQILQASYRARDLVKQILTFSRAGDQDMVPTQLTAVIAESLQLIQASLPPHIELITQFDTSNDTVFGDPTQIHQVITNLCTNAIHAMARQGGTLKLQVSERETAKCFNPPTDIDLPKTMLLLKITDTGGGISGEVIDHIFEPYFTTKRVGEGTGFGLALVHGIVKSHNGYIEVTSQEGHGTCFRIFLPQGAKQQKVVNNEEQTSLPTGNGHVLFVDDERQQLEWGTIFLNKLGFLVTAAESGKEAVDIFNKSPSVFDILITDQTMPAMTGLELSTWIRTIRADIPIILCTGVSQALSVEKIRSAGITRVVKKPYGLAELAEIINQNIK